MEIYNTETWEPIDRRHKKPLGGKKPLEGGTKKQATQDSIGEDYATTTKEKPSRPKHLTHQNGPRYLHITHHLIEKHKTPDIPTLPKLKA